MSLGHSRRFERSLGSCAVRLDNQGGSSLAWMYAARLDNRGGLSLAWMCAARLDNRGGLSLAWMYAARLANRGLVTWPSVTALQQACMTKEFSAPRES